MERLTPLLEQYERVKSRYQDAILLFRIGDFYEMFFDDAKQAARLLGVVLTSKSLGKNNRVPLAGIPHRAAESYIHKLVQSGLKVAICEQLEDPETAKGIVKRDVVEVITPGTILRPSLLQESKNLFLAAVYPDNSQLGFALCDLTTGDFTAGETDLARLNEEIRRLEIRELVAPSGRAGDLNGRVGGVGLTLVDDSSFLYDVAYRKLKSHFQVVTLEGFGIEEKKTAIQAAGALIAYLEENQKSSLPHIRKMSRYHDQDFLYVDYFTRRNLEIFEQIHGGEENTLFAVLDGCLTSFGKRELRMLLLKPEVLVKKIRYRQDGVRELKTKYYLREELRGLLANIHDVERMTSRIALGRGSPREMVSLKDSLKIYPEIKELLKGSESEILKDIQKQLVGFTALVGEVEKTLVDSPPIVTSEGGLVREGVNAELDELRKIAHDAKKYLLEMQEQERRKTGIGSLKIAYNSVFGYYIEVTKPNLGLVPESYIRKQTLTNAERFYTPELKEFEKKILNSEERIAELEYEIYNQLREEVAASAGDILASTKALALADVIQGFSHTATIYNYSCPVVGEGDAIIIQDGRHPVIERLLEGGKFVPNDTWLDHNENQIIIITGPNMAGKSTYLRQVALIIIMAQVGSFVPARDAQIGVVDKIFSRIGASDDLARGVSTFLAEMMETANILNNATPKSLVILDELGRGTSTYDGLSLAWAVVEYLHNNAAVRAKTMFATHYHELTDIEKFLERVKNMNFTVKEYGEDIIFLRKLEKGASDRSYGIAVAKLAGLPREVISRAREILGDFEAGEQLSVENISGGQAHQLGLFTAGTDRKERPHPVVEKVKELSIDHLKPIEALNILNELKRLLGEVK